MASSDISVVEQSSEVDSLRRKLSESEGRIAHLLAENAAIAASARKAQAEAEAERQRLRELIERAPAHIMVHRGNRHEIELSNAYHKQELGERPLIGRPLLEAIPELADLGVIELFDKALRTGESQSIDELPLRVRSRDGTHQRRVYNVLIEPRRGSDGLLEGVTSFAFDVTDQVSARWVAERLAEELAHQRRWLETVLDHLPVAATLIEPGTARVTFSNKASKQLWGKRFAAAVLVDAQGQQLAPERMPTARAARGEGLNGELIEVRSEAGQAWLLVDSAHVPQMAGQPAMVILVHRDVSRLREAEREAREREQQAERAQAQLRALLDGAPVGMALFDTRLRFLLVNDAMAAQHGLSAQAHLGRPLREVLPFAARAHEPALRAALTHREPIINHEISEQATGKASARHWLASYFPVRVEQEVVGIAVIVSDITERKQAEQTLDFLAEASRRLSSSLESRRVLEIVTELAVPVLSDVCLVLTWPNDEPAKLAALRHTSPSEHARLNDIFADGSTVQAALAGLRSSQPQLTARRVNAVSSSDGSWERACASLAQIANARAFMCTPLLVAGRCEGAILLGSFSPARVFGEAELALAGELAVRVGSSIDNARLFELASQERQRAEQANRVKDEFLAMVSHELRTPLNAIVGWTHLLQGGALDDAAKKRALDTIARNVQTQAQLVEDLLDISRIATGQLRLSRADLDLRQIVNAALDALRPAASAKELSLDSTIAADVGPFKGDATRIQQIVWNLLSNAVKFTPHRGAVLISITRTGDCIELSVNDTGQGITPDFLPYVFHAFRQEAGGTTRRHGGLGLGLAIVKHLVELHGGTVRAESKGQGKGARFITSLPVAPAETRTPPSKAPQPPANDAPRQPLRSLAMLDLLLVDDEDDARELLLSLLSPTGARVRVASSAAEALAAIETQAPDVLISDIGMPNFDGYSLITRVRALPPSRGGKTPAIALTAFARLEDRTRALMAGFTMHVSKPVDPDELLTCIAELTRHNHSRSQ